MSKVRIVVEPEALRIRAMHDGTSLDLPPLWLREQCQDEAHVDAATRQRLFDPHMLPEDVSLIHIQPRDERHVELAFSDGYQSVYDLDTLASVVDDDDEIPLRVPWHSDIDLSLTSFRWPDLADDEALHGATTAFLRYGFIILHDVPTKQDEVLSVARRFGHVRETNFGSYFEVYSRPGSNDLAYRAVRLGPHTDNPYRDPVPGIQLLHCLFNETGGGLSTLVDCLSVCAQLRDEDPEGFSLLASIPVRYSFRDKNATLVARRPIIALDGDGQVLGLHYSPRLDSLPVLPVAELVRFHRARRRLAELLSDPAYEIRFPLEGGDLMFFDNNRVLHGRTEFDPNAGPRHLQGCYIDTDGMLITHRRTAHA